MTKRDLATLQFETTDNYEENLTTLIDLIKQTPDNAIVLAPEVCLTDFDYEHISEASQFTSKAIKKLLKLSKERVITLSVIQEQGKNKYFNVAMVLHKEKVIHRQYKNRLFKLGDEHKYFSQGTDKRLSLFEIDGIRFGLMICFELRFKQFWQDLEGADIILVPARWGKQRSENFRVLTQALAVMNQCYVMCADGSNFDCTALSGIISPFGETVRNGNDLCLVGKYDKQEIRRMRRYINVGIQGE